MEADMSPIKLKPVKHIKLNQQTVPPFNNIQAPPPRKMSQSSGYTLSYEEIAANLSDREAVEKSLNDLNESFAGMSMKDEKESVSSVYSVSDLVGYMSNTEETK